MSILVIETGSSLSVNDDLLMKLSGLNTHIKMERDAEGNLIIMSPSATKTGIFQAEIIAELRNWNKKGHPGVVSDSQAGFKLPDGSVRSPDAAWISKGKWNALSEKQQEGFAPVCPDVVVEVLSPSDSLQDHFKKMDLWITQGAQLGLLIDPANLTYWVYRSASVRAEYPFSVPFSGDPVLPGFVLSFDSILQALS